jgi:hypothetical protein
MVSEASSKWDAVTCDNPTFGAEGDVTKGRRPQSPTNPIAKGQLSQGKQLSGHPRSKVSVLGFQFSTQNFGVAPNIQLSPTSRLKDQVSSPTPIQAIGIHPNPLNIEKHPSESTQHALNIHPCVKQLNMHQTCMKRPLSRPLHLH